MEPLSTRTHALYTKRSTAAPPARTVETPVARQVWAESSAPISNKPRFPSGPNSGRLVDIDAKRSARRLSPAEAASFGAQSGDLAVEDLQHGGRFYTAVIPKDAVESVDFEIEWYPDDVPLIDIGCHNQFRFQLKPGFEARLFEGGPKASPDVTLSELIYSVEGVHARGEAPFDAGSIASLKAGMHQTFMAAYRFTSVPQRASEMHSQGGTRHPIRPFRLAFPKSGTPQAVLEAFADDATRQGLTRLFHTTRCNCTTETFRVLDQHLDYGMMRRAAAWLVPADVPHFAATYVWIRGLIGEKEPLTFLRPKISSPNISP